MNIKKKIFLIAGEPNSVNSEIIFKSWKKLSKHIQEKIYVIGNYSLLKEQFNQLNYKIELEKLKELKSIDNNKLKIIDIDLNFNNPFKVKKKDAAKYIVNSLKKGHDLAISKNTFGLINCAISKNLLPKKKTGVTEFLANKCNIRDNSEVMLIKNNNLSVSPITTHIDLKDVHKNINSKKIILKIKTINKYFIKLFKKKPKIGILGLNPHNAELRKGSTEVTEIIPAINKLKKLKFKIDGPIVADTIFIKNFKKYDVIVGMYHDQVLSPFKSIFKFNGINLTLGLKYLRVSPDHGVAKDLIKKKQANYNSLYDCINFLYKFG
tara:strand:- start:107 stop:1072 length:966 start_codon:yes stop_codon:yes gene_type:complete